MKEKLISYDDVRKMHPMFRGKHGDRLIRLGLKVSGLNHVNQVYDDSKHLKGPTFCKDLLDKIGLTRTVRNTEVLEKLKGKPFITVSNHSYGHVDGIAAIETIASIIGDYKMMVNDILGMIDTLSENFITVHPSTKSNEGESASAVTLSGIKECILHLRNGHPLGLFPAGAIADFVRRGSKITIDDRMWQPSVLKLIKSAKVPVVPMHFSGKNSPRFYILGLLGWRVRILGLGHELYNKKGKEMIITLGEPISVETQAGYDDIEAFGNFLRARTFSLAQLK